MLNLLPLQIYNRKPPDLNSLTILHYCMYRRSKILYPNSLSPSFFFTVFLSFVCLSVTVMTVQKLFKTSITHFYFFTYRVSSSESRPIQVPSPNAQARVPTVKEPNEPNGKKKPGAGRTAPRCVEPRE